MQTLDDTHTCDGHDYSGLLTSISDTYKRVASNHVFLTNVSPIVLWDAYLNLIPVSIRQEHNCNACRRFIQQYGGLVALEKDGTQKSIFWDPMNVSPPYRPSFAKMRNAVEKAAISTIFFSDETTWGTPETGPWKHMSVNVPRDWRFNHPITKPHEEMASYLQGFASIKNALHEFRKTSIETTIGLLNAPHMIPSGKRFVAEMEWFRDLPRAGTNVFKKLWYMLAWAPRSYLHFRASAVCSLLKDIDGGMDLAEAARRFNEKVAPINYQRPKVDPGLGNIRQAEKLVDALGIAGSLKRRFARMEDLTERLWSPLQEQHDRRTDGVFSGVMPREAARDVPKGALVQGGGVPMTWRRFAEEILPQARQMKLRVPYVDGNYTALLTAVDPDAPPILKWDMPEKRNPVSWYQYVSGSSAAQWNLAHGRQVDIKTVIKYPSRWNDRPEHAYEGVVLILEGCVDMRTGGSSGLFPEILKPELYPVRKTIESYSRQTPPEGRDEATACGLALTPNGRWPNPYEIFVTTSIGTTAFKIDRFH
jgi:hypothetical protein